MTEYLLSVHHDGIEDPGAGLAPEVMQEMYAAVDRFNTEVQEAGAWVFAGGLLPIESATMVRAHEGETVITDGPFSETKEYLGGFWVIQAADLDEALAWAAKGSAACQGPVEVRPFQGE